MGAVAAGLVYLLEENPLVLLFALVAIGYPLGRLKLAGVRLGVASVLFTALGVGAVSPRLKLPEIVYQLGLVVFVYALGIASGRTALASLRRRPASLVLTAGAAGAVAGAAWLFKVVTGSSAALAAGSYAGILTNTPALAAVIDLLKIHPHAPPTDALLTDLVIGYSMTYPVAVLASILSVVAARRIWQVDWRIEASRAGHAHAPRLESATLRVTRADATGKALDDLIRQHGWVVSFGRRRHEGELSVVIGNTALLLGDLVSVIGTPEEIRRAATSIGEVTDERLDLDRRRIDFRSVFVSGPAVAGHRLGDLDLPKHFGAIVTRVRRGDLELVPNSNTVLELGDQVRVVAPRASLDGVARLLGDSYRAVSEVDVLTLSVGLALGLLLGQVPLPLPRLDLKLGIAGGPLIVGLALGAAGRFGKLVWALPFSASLTLRQLGLVMFLAGIGTRAGDGFAAALAAGRGWPPLLLAVLVTPPFALLVLWIGHRRMRRPLAETAGLLAGIQTQPAVLGFALDQSRNDLPTVGYVSAFPVATIVKILLAQLLAVLLL